VAETTRKFTKGDTRNAVFGWLFKADMTPIALSTIPGATVKFRMVKQDGTVKIAGAAAAIDDPGSPTTPAVVRYDWSPADVDTPGDYWCWFILVDGSLKTEHFPQGHGFALKILDEV
jgi:hypothetical protein